MSSVDHDLAALLDCDDLKVGQSRKVLVHYDYAAQRSRPLPEELRQKLLAQDPDLTIEV